MESVKAVVLPLLAELSDRLENWKALVSVKQGCIFDPVTGETIDDGRSLAMILTEAVCAIDVPTNSVDGSVDRFPGVFSVSAELIEATHALNKAKADLEAATRSLNVKWREMRALYAMAGWARIHPLMAWRRINVLEPEGLYSIGFTVAKKESAIEVLGLEELSDRLADREAFDVIDQARRLGSSHFRWHEPVAPHVRANVVWKNGSLRETRMHLASMPFLIEAPNWPSKRVRFNKPRTHATRSDIKSANTIPLPFRKGGFISALTPSYGG